LILEAAMNSDELNLWMKSKNITVLELSKLCGSHVNTIYQWKNGKRKIPSLFVAWIKAKYPP
jgi:transcriptional regulator with XRE-family HTH domain